MVELFVLDNHGIKIVRTIQCPLTDCQILWHEYLDNQFGTIIVLYIVEIVAQGEDNQIS